MGSTRYYGHTLPGVEVAVDMDGVNMPSIMGGGLPAAKCSLLLANASGRTIVNVNTSFGDEIDGQYIAACDIFSLDGDSGVARHVILPLACDQMCLVKNFGQWGTTFEQIGMGQVYTPLLVMTNNGFSDAAAWMIAQHISAVAIDLNGNCFPQGAVDQLMQYASAFQMASIDISGGYGGINSAVPSQDIVVTADAEDTDGINGTYAKTGATTWTRTAGPAATITYDVPGSKWVITVGAVTYSYDVEDETIFPITALGYVKDGGSATATTTGSETSQYFWMLVLTGCVITTN